MRPIPYVIGLDYHVIKTERPLAPRIHGWSLTRSTTTPISVSLFGIIDAFEHVGISHEFATKDYSQRLIGFSQFGA